MYRVIIMIFFVVATSACTTIKTAIAMTQSTDDFLLTSKKNGLIYTESESSPLAKEAEKYLDDAIKVIEIEQYRNFAKPVKIYAISSLDSFKRHCGFRLVLGCVINEKVFLSPRILTQPVGTLPRLLTHELSHLHIVQQLSMLKWGDVPTWFREGLAVYVSSKSEGAKMDFSDVIDQFKEGETFYPNESGSIIFPKNHTNFNLSRPIFYRQAGNFVKFLYDSDNQGFRSLLLSVQDRKQFSESFKEHYGVSLDEKWKEYKVKLI